VPKTKLQLLYSKNLRNSNDSTSAKNETPTILLPPKTELQLLHSKIPNAWWGRNRPWQDNL